MTDNEQLQSRLKIAIKNSGMTQSAIAEEAGIARGSIPSIVSHGHIPRSDTLRLLCRVLGVSADWILNLKQKPGDYAQRQWDQVVFRQALEKFGWEAQRLVLLEEMAELQDAVCKEVRERDVAEHIAEEVADVEIMLEQVKLHFGVEEIAREIRGEKIKRLRGRVDSK